MYYASTHRLFILGKTGDLRDGKEISEKYWSQKEGEFERKRRKMCLDERC